MEKTKDNDKILQAINAFVVNSHINNYAVERVVFGYEKPGDPVPIDLYIKHLHLDANHVWSMRRDIPGVYIDERECVSDEFDYDEYVHDMFVMQMERIFAGAPKDIDLESADEEIPILPRFRDYLFELLPMFTEVLNTEVKYDAFDLIVTDKEARVKEYSQWLKFVTAILLKPIRPGSQINKYVKDINSAPFYVNRLIEQKGSSFYLKPIDINDCVYIFALFSLMQFKNDENVKLLELKMFEWERLHKPD